jgi:hypothetical protein
MVKLEAVGFADALQSRSSGCLFLSLTNTVQSPGEVHVLLPFRGCPSRMGTVSTANGAWIKSKCTVLTRLVFSATKLHGARLSQQPPVSLTASTVPPRSREVDNRLVGQGMVVEWCQRHNTCQNSRDGSAPRRLCALDKS